MTAPRRRPPTFPLALAAVLASSTPVGVVSTEAFASSAALKTAVDNCLDATPDGTGASCCSSAGADCGVAGSTDMPDWNVTGVTNFSELFLDRVAFDQNISAWDVSAVTDMRATFRNASSFDADISAWNVSSVTSTCAPPSATPPRSPPTCARGPPSPSSTATTCSSARTPGSPPTTIHPRSSRTSAWRTRTCPRRSCERRARRFAFASTRTPSAYFLAVPVGVDFGVVDPATGAVRTVPTPAEVREGTDGPVGTFGRDGLVSGAIDVAAGETASANVTNLTEASANDVWVVAATRNGTLQSHVSLVDARTRDMTPPGFLPVDDGGASAPRLFVGARSVDVASRLTETGAAFLVAQSPETQAPTAAQIRARALAGESGTCAVNATVAEHVYGCGVFDLLEVTDHSAFYTVEDAPEFTSPNLLETAFRFDFQTRDATPPVGALTLGDVREDGFDVHARSTKNGTVLWVVVPAEAPAPTFEEVRAGVARGGLAPVASGRVDRGGASANLLGAASRALAVGSANGTVAVVGLRPETAYDLHAVFADDQNANDPGVNFNATVVTLARVVTLDVDPPTVDDLAVENVTSAGFTLALTVDEPARVHYVVVPRWRPAPTPLADAPTPEEVAAGTGRRRSAAAACGFVDVAPRRRPRRGSRRRRRRRESSRARRMRERRVLRRERGRVDRGGARRRRKSHRDGRARRRRRRRVGRVRRRRRGVRAEIRRRGRRRRRRSVVTVGPDGVIVRDVSLVFARRGRTTCGWWRRMTGTIPRPTRRRVGTARRRLAGRIGSNARRARKPSGSRTRARRRSSSRTRARRPSR